MKLNTVLSSIETNFLSYNFLSNIFTTMILNHKHRIKQGTVLSPVYSIKYLEEAKNKSSNENRILAIH